MGLDIHKTKTVITGNKRERATVNFTVSERSQNKQKSISGEILKQAREYKWRDPKTRC